MLFPLDLQYPPLSHFSETILKTTTLQQGRRGIYLCIRANLPAELILLEL